MDGNQDNNNSNFHNNEDIDSEDEYLYKISGTKQKKAIATWSKDEIKLLQILVGEYGTDFAILSTKLGKSRDQVKRKFKIMQKKNANFGFKSS